MARPTPATVQPPVSARAAPSFNWGDIASGGAGGTGSAAGSDPFELRRILARRQRVCCLPTDMRIRSPRIF